MATLVLLSACGDQATQPLSDPRGLILLGTVAYPADIYVMRPDGSGLRQLTRDTTNDVDPSWAPDGKHIVFSRAPTGGDRWADLYIMNADGSQQRLLYHGARPARASRSMYTIRPDGTDEHLVAGDSACVGNVQEARFSPDGTRIAYRCDDAPGGAIFVIHADGAAPVRLSPASPSKGVYMYDRYPAWSPDGAQIVFYSNRVTYLFAPWVMDSTGANATRIGGRDEADLIPADWGAAAR